MNFYLVSIVNSGGRLVRQTVQTEYELRKVDDVVEVYENGRCVGQEECVKEILTKNRGWHEDVLIVNITALADGEQSHLTQG